MPIADRAKRGDDIVWLSAALAAAGFLLAPRLALAWLVALVALLVALTPARTRLSQPGAYVAGPVTIGGLVLVIYLLINATWSADPVDGAGKALLLAALLIVTRAAAIALSAVPASALKLPLRAMLAAVLLAAGLLLVEEASGHLVKHTVYDWVPALRPSAKHLMVDGDQVAGVAAYISNRSMAALVLLIWPLLLAARLLPPGAVARLVPGLLLALTAATLALSQHESSIVALLAGGFAWLLARLTARGAMVLLLTGWVVANLLVVPIVQQLYAGGLHLSERLPVSTRARVILWNYTAAQVSQRPWFGVGISATKRLDDRSAGRFETLPGHVYPQRTAAHAHNVYLQAWYELGAVGVMLWTLFGAGVIAALGRLSRQQQPYAAAAFASAATLAAFSYGLWQPWFMGAYALQAALLLTALAAGRERDGAAGVD